LASLLLDHYPVNGKGIEDALNGLRAGLPAE
jgi:hypothetical protein